MASVHLIIYLILLKFLFLFEKCISIVAVLTGSASKIWTRIYTEENSDVYRHLITIWFQFIILFK